MFYTPDQPGPPHTVMPDNTGPAFLTRQLGRNATLLRSGSLPTQQEWDATKAITIYDSAPWDESVGAALNATHFQGVPSFRNVFEGFIPYDPASAEPEMHNKVHLWVGGAMAPISSPNDPIFFLHHCNVDRLWAEWQLANPGVPYIPDGSTPALTGPEGHNLNDAMHPWDGFSRNFVTPTGTTNITLPVVRVRDVLNHATLGYRYDTDPPSLSVAP
jgi:tyrosinase